MQGFKSLQVSAFEKVGGAAIAAERLNTALRRNYGEQASTLYATSRSSGHLAGLEGGSISSVTNKLLRKVLTNANHVAGAGFLRSNDQGFRSYGLVGHGLKRKIIDRRKTKIDVVNLHWTGDWSLSLKEIAGIQNPLVWTMHDEWALEECDHYSKAVEIPENPRSGLALSDRKPGYKNTRVLDAVDRYIIKLKRRALQNADCIVTPSRWLEHRFKRSPLAAGVSVKRIPYAIDCREWTPGCQDAARRNAGIPLDAFVVLFGAVDCDSDPRKGGDLLDKALRKLQNEIGILDPRERRNIVVVTYGGRRTCRRRENGLERVDLGKLYEADDIRNAYTVADLFVIPSRADNLPNVVIEAQACGTPVLSFNIGGLSDMIDHGWNGRMCLEIDYDCLYQELSHLLRTPRERLLTMGENARKKALLEWSDETVSRQYAELYHELLRIRRGQARN